MAASPPSQLLLRLCRVAGRLQRRRLHSDSRDYRTYAHRAVSSLSQPLSFALSASSSFPSSSRCCPLLRRSYTTLPVIEEYVPRVYPFPLTLTTELLEEDDLQTGHLRPHDLPPYKSTLSCNLLDLPLTAAERRVFRLLVGQRVFSSTFHPHPTPAFLREPRGGRGVGQGRHPYLVRFVSRHLPSAEANENRVFQMLDECVRVSKLLCAEMAEDGEVVEMGEDEQVMAEARRRLKVELREERERQQRERQEAQQAALAGGGGEAEQQQQISGDSAGQQQERRETIRIRSTGPKEDDPR